MFDRLSGWIEGFTAAAHLVPQQMLESSSSDVWGAIISAGGAVLSGIVGVVGAIIGTKVGAKANQAATLAAAGHLAEVERKRFVDERIWEERRRAYSLILTSLHEAGNFWSEIETGFSQYGDDEGFFRSEIYKEWRHEALVHWMEVKRIFSENRLILSKDFVSKVSGLKEEVAAISEDHDPLGEPTRMKRIFRAAAAEMLEIAQREIVFGIEQ